MFIWPQYVSTLMKDEQVKQVDKDKLFELKVLLRNN